MKLRFREWLRRRSSGFELQGHFTVWDDMQNSLIGKRLYSTAGKVDYDYDEIAIAFASGGSMAEANDRVTFPLQMQHKKKLGTAIRLHLHLEQEDDTEREFTLAYRVQKQGAAKTTDWTEITLSTADDAAFTYSSDTLNQTVSFPEIPVNDVGVSDIVQCRLARTDSAGGTVLVTFADAHFEIDAWGSAGEYTKWTES